ncbi:AcrR family transcriptional regulator [Streptacidiphilus sp. MAP12-20]|uniref:TetR family transcriptional regulator n=1 Tax=Streptacidiphilus sp. MAP12-20 TaxID=3156299 RepID=UPI0035119D1A
MSSNLQPSLTERRKAATQLDIARAAAELFADRGPDGTTAEEIAQRAGIALRTFYRYFRNKEDAVSPLLSAGGAYWRALLAAEPPGTDLREALAHAARMSLTPTDAAGAEALEGTRGLLRAAARDAALRAVWYRVNQESEEQLTPVLAGLADRGELELKMIAACATDAIRLSLEAWATTSAPADGPEGPAALADACMRRLLQWL